MTIQVPSHPAKNSHKSQGRPFTFVRVECTGDAASHVPDLLSVAFIARHRTGSDRSR
jgi:hypothetical protein